VSRLIRVLEGNGLLVRLPTEHWVTTDRWRSAMQDVGRSLVAVGHPGTDPRVVSSLALARLFPTLSADAVAEMARIMIIVEFASRGRWVHLPLDDQGPSRFFRPRTGSA